MSKSSLWKAQDAALATRGKLLGDQDWVASGVSIDSRSAEAGDLFVALDGLNQDGHKYVAAALEKGAAAVLVTHKPGNVAENAPLLQVTDTLEGLNALGIAARDRCSAKRIAVTGSAGKTGTKEMLRIILGAQAATHASVASYNNLWGVPLSLARMPANSAYGIFEIGMNHAGEIIPLTALAKPHVAIITTIAPVHLEFFADLNAIADAKAEIFTGLEAGGTAIINADIEQSQRLCEAALRVENVQLMRFGHASGAEARLLSADYDAAGSTVQADICGSQLTYRLPMPGEHLVLNSLAVLAAVYAVGADVKGAAEAFAQVEPVKGRGVVHEVVGPNGAFTVIDESYNANPASMTAAIKTLGARKQASGGRAIAVLGDMLELGPDADTLHADLSDVLEKSEIDLAFLSGAHMAALWDTLPAKKQGGYGATSAELLDTLMTSLKKGDVVMIKGSLGSRMGPLVDALITLDDNGQKKKVGEGLLNAL